MSFIYANPDNNTTPPNSDPLFQYWEPIPSVVNKIYNSVLGTIPEDYTEIIKIRDLFGTTYENNYNQFRYLTVSNYVGVSNIEWLDITSLPAIPISYTPILENGITFDVDFAFKNLTLLPVGQYQYNIKFLISGRYNSGSPWQNIDTYTYTINLDVTTNNIQFNPSSIEFNHYEGNSNLETAVINLTGNNWTIVNSLFNSANGSKLHLTTSASGVTESIDVVNGVSLQSLTGSGAAQITVSLTSYYNSQNIDPLYLSGHLAIFSQGAFISGIPFVVNILDVADININPSSLNFSAIKGFQEPIYQNITANSLLPITLSHSPWLIVNNTGNVYEVKPIPTDNMSPGIYDGFVKFSTNDNGAITTKETSVNYNLSGLLVSPYVPGQTNFTLDPKEFEFYSNSLNTYIQLDFKIKVFEFFTNIEHIFEIANKLVFYKGKATLNIGLLIHRLMKKFSNPNQNVFQYLPAILNIDCYEKNIIDNTIVRSINVQEMKFYAGLNKGFENIGFLDFNSKANRVTPKSKEIINILVPSGDYQMVVLRNSTAPITFSLPVSNEIVISKHISFEQYTPGDVIDVYIQIPSESEYLPFKKSFLVLPEGKQSNHIIWENEFLLQSILECTGEYSIKTDFEFSSQKLYQKLVEIMEVVSVSKEVKFSINTGWLLSSDVDRIDSLMASKRIWLEDTENQSFISLRPAGKTIINKDSQRALNEYSLEFIINRKYNEETYSF